MPFRQSDAVVTVWIGTRTLFQIAFQDIGPYQRFRGDSISDMLFAKNAGMRGVFIGNKYGPGEVSKTLYQAHYADLLSFAQAFFL